MNNIEKHPPATEACYQRDYLLQYLAFPGTKDRLKVSPEVTISFCIFGQLFLFIYLFIFMPASLEKLRLREII